MNFFFFNSVLYLWEKFLGKKQKPILPSYFVTQGKVQVTVIPYP